LYGPARRPHSVLIRVRWANVARVFSSSAVRIGGGGTVVDRGAALAGALGPGGSRLRQEPSPGSLDLWGTLAE